LCYTPSSVSAQSSRAHKSLSTSCIDDVSMFLLATNRHGSTNYVKLILDGSCAAFPRTSTETLLLIIPPSSSLDSDVMSGLAHSMLSPWANAQVHYLYLASQGCSDALTIAQGEEVYDVCACGMSPLNINVDVFTLG